MGKTLLRFKRVLVFLQTGWSILGITLVFLLLTESVARLSFFLRDQVSAPPLLDRRLLADGFGGAAWAVAHYRELAQIQERWEPFFYFQPKPFRGQTITIDDHGLRRTWQPKQESDGADARQRVKILALGGSSLWGFGARDDQTIPSNLARELDARGWRVDLKNLSGLGYVSTQELIALVRELQAGNRPDVVIFYDGVNDTTSALLEGQAGLSTNEINRRTEFNLLQSAPRLASTLSAKVITSSALYRFATAVRRRFEQEAPAPGRAHAEDGIESLADGVVSRFQANCEMAQALGREFGFRPLFFWQPTVFDKPDLAVVEREEASKYAWAEPMFRAVYGRIRAAGRLKAEPAFYDMSEIFADSHEFVFIDYCHTTETANERIARVMADRVIAQLRKPVAANAVPAGDGSAHRRRDAD